MKTTDRGIALVAALSPSGRVLLDVLADIPPGTSLVNSATATRLRAAFAEGTGAGLLHLGAVEVDTPLDATASFWRRLASGVVEGVCGSADADRPHEVQLSAPPPGLMNALLESVPPMRGGERVDRELLERLWDKVGEAITRKAIEHPDGLQGYLEASHAVWNVAGKICLHLAENKGDPEFPFAFLATWARPVPGQSKPRHVPLRLALQEYAGAGDGEKLLSLLSPLQRAAKKNAVIGDLLESGDIYHPLAWTVEAAHAFLLHAEDFKQAGVVLRLPDWWKARQQRRPSVSITLGSKEPSGFGLDALLDFQIGVTLGGEALTVDEIEALLATNASLLWMKGQWVEVDKEKLGDVLDHWRDVEAMAGNGGVSFVQAMRMISGADVQEEEEAADRPQWSTVVAGEWLETQLDALRDPSIHNAISDNAGLNAVLRPYQRVGVQWLWNLNRLGLGGCLADDMGLGKTIQVIGLLQMLHGRLGSQGVDLLVVPASLLNNWREELQRFAPGLRVFIAHSSNVAPKSLKALSPEEVSEYHVVITTYGMASRLPWAQEMPWRSVVLDEAQAIKNPNAKQTRAIKKLKGRWRLALTGTPVENRLGDIWSIFDFLNPGLLGSAQGFGVLCNTMAESEGDGYAPLRRLLSPYILRRLKTDREIIPDLPDKTELKSWCLLAKSQALLYEQAVDGLRQALEGASTKMERRGLILSYLMRFKQICNHPSQWLGDGAYQPKQSGKFQRLAELCVPIVERQEKLIVFTQFKTMCAPLQRFLSGCFGRSGLVLHGSVRVKNRGELVRRFQEDEEVPFMVLSIKAGGTGLNLTAANHVVHFDRWWNPAVENQATDRAFRIGQQKNVLVHKFICKGTVEERIDALIASKQALSDQVLGGKAAGQLTEMSNEEIMDMVRLDLRSAVSP